MDRGRPLKVCLKTPFSRYSGYGNDGFGLLRALNEWGCDVYPQPVWMDCPIPRDVLPLFGKTLVPPFDLLINHWDPDHIEITREARQASRIAVAWSMWEFSPAPPGNTRPCKDHQPCKVCGKQLHAYEDHPFLPTDRSPHAVGVPDCPRCRHVNSGFYPHAKNLRRKADIDKDGLRGRLRWFDLFLGYDDVSLSAFAPFIPKTVHSAVLQGGYESKLWRPVERDWHGDRFQFAMHGALNHRKAPWTVIEAWFKLKHEKGEAFKDARLALHTSIPGVIFPELNTAFEPMGAKVFCSSLDMQALKDFYAAAHVLLAPSRGEGKNLPALEFGSTAGAIAATNYGGHTQWIGADWAYPLDYTLGPTFGDCPWGAHDAKVSVDYLADMIWHIYTHREEARQKGLRAAEMLPKMCDWSVVVENLFRRIRELPHPGPVIYDQAMACRRVAEDPSEFTFPVSQ